MNVWSKTPPFFYMLTGSVIDLANYYERLRSKEKPSVVFRLLRGEDMEDSKRFFAEVASALQFPLYFGKNMNALAECLRDLGDWLPAESYVLMISQTSLVLRKDSQSDLVDFFKLLAEVAGEWSVGTLSGTNWERKPSPFHVILQSDTQGADILGRILEPVLGDIPRIESR